MLQDIVSVRNDEVNFCSFSERKNKEPEQAEQIYRARSHGWVNLNKKQKKSRNGSRSVSAFTGRLDFKAQSVAWWMCVVCFYRAGIASGSWAEERPSNISLLLSYIYHVCRVKEDTCSLEELRVRLWAADESAGFCSSQSFHQLISLINTPSVTRGRAN